MCVLDLFRNQVSSQPNALAVADGDQRLTYRQLDSLASRNAAVLREAGVGPQISVALCMRRSIEFVAGALAILKTGAAYVPLDPENPSTRLDTLLQDSGAGLVLTDEETSPKIPKGSWQKITLAKSGVPSDLSTSSISPEIDPESLAYIIFTSGSTGRPKGVEITHANLHNLVLWHIRTFGVKPGDRATLLASPGFDAAVWELWPYLAAGASVHVADEEVRTSPEKLQRWLLENECTISFVPTAIAEAMNDLAWPSSTSLRFLLTGADTLRRYPRPGLPFTLVNNYGPTECTVVSTSGSVPDSGEKGSDLPSIGRPIDGATARIVDEQLSPVPDGVAGELLVGGTGVGRGYRNQPALTAERFITVAVDDSQLRFYRTGDRVRKLPNGEFEFLGRIDDQMKIRGYRVEPGEIVSALGLHPQVSASFVRAAANGSGEKHLIAYVVAQSGIQLRESELREFLLARVPDYMVPATFVALDVLPMSASGKVDRSQLPEPTEENILRDRSLESPQSDMEKWLAGFLATLVGTSQIGRDDNFFQLGGHSLMGAQVIAKVQQTFGVELSLRSLFEQPTIREISGEIEKLLDDKLAAMSEEDARQLLETGMQ